MKESPVLKQKREKPKIKQQSEDYTQVVLRLGIRQAESIRVAQRKGMKLVLTVDEKDYCWIEYV